MRKIALLSLSCLAVLSCNNGGRESLKYEPVKDLKGEVRKVVTYSYESDIQKNKIIAKYGAPIPKSIICYNKYGSPEVSIEFSLPKDDEPQICLVGVDSSYYDKKNHFIGRRSHVIFVLPEDFSNFDNPTILLNSEKIFATNVIVRSEVMEEKNKRIEKFITEQTLDQERFKTLPQHMQSIIRDRFFWQDDNSFLDTGTLPNDTTTTIREYDGRKVIRELTERKDDVTEVLTKFEGDNPIEELHIHNSDTTKIVFSYKNGILNEKRVGGALTRYDEQGREIAEIQGNNQSIMTYKDTTKLSTHHFVFSRASNSVYFYRYNKDGLELFSAGLHLEDKDTYVDDAVLLFENFRDGLIDEGELSKGMESIIYKVEDSSMNSIEKKTYSNYDSHGNPLKIVETIIRMSNSYAYMSNSYLKYYLEKKVNKYNYKQITEREIEYFK